MRLRKIKKVFLYFLIAIIGLLFLAVVLINFPFAHRFITKKVNNILSNAHIPVYINSIGTILPNSVVVNGVTLFGVNGDTIIHSEKLGASFATLALLKKRVIISSVVLSNSGINLSRTERDLEINIAEAFSSKKSKIPGDEISKKKPWEVAIGSAEISGINFRMKDSVSGIYIDQKVDNIKVKTNKMSLIDKVIHIQSLDISGADGSIRISERPETDNSSTSSPWNFGAANISLININESFDDSGKKIMAGISIEECKIKTRNSDINNKTIDLSRLFLSGISVSLRMNRAPEVENSKKTDDAFAFPWNIKCSDLKLETFTVGYGGYPDESHMQTSDEFVISDLNLTLSDLVLSDSSAGFKANSLNFHLNNGFSLKKFKGDLDSRDGKTTLDLSVETGNSQINLSGASEENLFDIISEPGKIKSLSISLSKTRISIVDLLFFNPGLGKLPAINFLKKDPFTIKGDLILLDSVIRMPDFSVYQASNIGVSMQGQIIGGINPRKARVNLKFRVPDINTLWLTGILKEVGFDNEITDFTSLSVEGTVSDTFKSPHFTLNVISNIGNIDLSGSLDYNNDSFKLNSHFRSIHIGRIISNDLIGSFTGSGEISGNGIRKKSISAGGLISVDSLMFKGYNYTNAKIDFTLLLPDVKLRLFIDDQLLNLDLTADINTSDSLLVVKSNTKFKANLRELNLFKDTLTASGAMRADFKKSKILLESDLDLSDIVLSTPQKNIAVKNVFASFISDTVKTSLSGESDFFDFTINLQKPVSELNTVPEEYRNYVNSFTDTDHSEAETRVSFLPNTDSKINFVYHEAVEVFIKNFQYKSIDISLNNNPSEGKLEYIILGKDIKYNNLAVGKLNSHITDSAGYLNVYFQGDTCMFASYPINKLLLTSRLSAWKGITSLSLLGPQNKILYGFELSPEFDSSAVHLKVPSKQLIMNGIKWQLNSEDILTYDFREKNLTPALRMYFNDSYLNIITDLTDNNRVIKFDLKNVNTNLLFPEKIIDGNPGAVISGSALLKLDRDKRSELSTSLNLNDVRWNDLNFNKIELEGNYISENKESWTIGMSSRFDSTEIVLNAEKPDGDSRSVKAGIKNFPARTMEPFVKNFITNLKGVISGYFNITSEGGNENFDGEINISDGGMRITSLKSGYRIPDEKIMFSGKKVVFDNFTVLDSLDNKLSINGSLDLSIPGSILTNMEATSSDLQIMNRGEKDNSSFYGKIFIDSRVSVKGLIPTPEIKGNLRLTKGTEIFYSKKEDLSLSESEKVISFISRTSLNEQNILQIKGGSVTRKGISVESLVEIDPETIIHFNLAQKLYLINLMVKGGGALNYNMLDNNQMNLTGKYEIGEGTANVKMIGWPNKLFQIASGGSVRWDGNVEDPVLQFEALNKVRTSYTNPVDGKVRDVDFNVIFKISDRLSELNLVFTVNTPDQYLMSIINTLSPEEQMRQAITVLLFEKIDLPGISTSTDYVTEQVNQMVASQLNAITKTTIKGVDISFGIDTYTSASQSGGEQTKTSLSYDVKKSLLNDRAKLEISGRVNDYANQQSSSNISLNNFSFEYRLDSAATKFVKVYNEHTYEDVFEGEVIKTGIGFIYRKSYRSIVDIWKRDDKKKKSKQKVQ